MKPIPTKTAKQIVEWLISGERCIHSETLANGKLLLSFREYLDGSHYGLDCVGIENTPKAIEVLKRSAEIRKAKQ